MTAVAVNTPHELPGEMSVHDRDVASYTPSPKETKCLARKF